MKTMDCKRQPTFFGLFIQFVENTFEKDLELP